MIESQQRPSAEAIIDEWLDVYENVTRFAFSVVATEQDGGCHYWPARPPERFSGPWNRTLRNPMLVMSARVRFAVCCNDISRFPESLLVFSRL